MAYTDLYGKYTITSFQTFGVPKTVGLIYPPVTPLTTQEIYPQD
jgi:hypothetical protein